jgi:hypothetical protein
VTYNVPFGKEALPDHSLAIISFPLGPVRWQYWRPHSDFLSNIRDPHYQDLDTREPVSQVSNRFEHGKFRLNFIRQCKELSNLCHTIENYWLTRWKGNSDQNISLEVLANLARTMWLRMVRLYSVYHILVS